MLPVPVSSFPFPYYPDTGTGYGYLNRTYVGLLAQPLLKRTSLRLTPLHTCDLAIPGSQPATPTCAKCTSTSHGKHPLDQLIRALVYLRSLLDSLTPRIPYAEPGDLGAVFPAQHYHTRDAHQVQAVAIAEKRLCLSVVHALPYTSMKPQRILQMSYFCSHVTLPRVSASHRTRGRLYAYQDHRKCQNPIANWTRFDTDLIPPLVVQSKTQLHDVEHEPKNNP
jgi:hypothetical protein